MFGWLILLFTVIPAIEIGLFVVVGGQIGSVSTIAVVIFTGAAGASLARMQGLRVLRQIQEAMGRGEMPTDELVHGAIVLFGGTLLLTPGFLTDAFGISCLLPPIRTIYALAVKRWASRRITKVGPGRTRFGGFHVWTGGVHPGPAAQQQHIDLGAGEAAEIPAPSPRTIDASFTVVDEGEDEPQG